MRTRAFPAEAGSDDADEKKTSEAITEELRKEVERIVGECLTEKQKRLPDLEATEWYIRSSMHEVGRRLLERVLNAQGAGYRGSSIRCQQGHRSRFVEYREKEVLTVLGLVRIERSYYYDRRCEQGECPRDAELDIEGTQFSPGMRRMMARVGALRPYAQGRDDIRELAGLHVNAKDIERISYDLGPEVDAFSRKKEEVERKATSGGANVIAFEPPAKILYICMDGTGVPLVPKELIGRKGKAEDGRARTREAKLGCIFTQTTVDEEGFPVRDEASTSYVGAIECADEFARRLVAEAERRGVNRAQEVCMIGDGAEWIWNIAHDHFPGARQIVDLYHAREYYWELARAFYPAQEKRLHEWTEARREELDHGDVASVIRAIRRLRPRSTELRKLCETAVGYYANNEHRMHYEEFRRKGLFVGSGVLEAGCRTVIGQRLKLSGMHWTVQGSNNIIALRCCILSGRWEDFWAHRASA